MEKLNMSKGIIQRRRTAKTYTTEYMKNNTHCSFFAGKHAEGQVDFFLSEAATASVFLNIIVVFF
jgi:hypothetical protein